MQKQKCRKHAKEEFTKKLLGRLVFGKSMQSNQPLKQVTALNHTLQIIQFRWVEASEPNLRIQRTSARRCAQGPEERDCSLWLHVHFYGQPRRFALDAADTAKCFHRLKSAFPQIPWRLRGDSSAEALFVANEKFVPQDARELFQFYPGLSSFFENRIVFLFRIRWELRALHQARILSYFFVCRNDRILWMDTGFHPDVPTEEQVFLVEFLRRTVPNQRTLVDACARTVAAQGTTHLPLPAELRALVQSRVQNAAEILPLPNAVRF